MISSVNIEVLIILLMVSVAILSILVLSIARYRLTREKNKFKKEHIALLINDNKMIEMMVPINERKQLQSINQYSVRRQTETFHPTMETNEDYYESILSTTELPYYPVRETTFQSPAKTRIQVITDSNEDDCSIESELKYI